MKYIRQRCERAFGTEIMKELPKTHAWAISGPCRGQILAVINAV